MARLNKAMHHSVDAKFDQQLSYTVIQLSQLLDINLTAAVFGTKLTINSLFRSTKFYLQYPVLCGPRPPIGGRVTRYTPPVYPSVIAVHRKTEHQGRQRRGDGGMHHPQHFGRGM